MATAEANGIPRPNTRPEFVANTVPGLVSSHGISINLPPAAHDGRPYPVKHMSMPSYQSPIRHHRRAPSRSKAVKETLNARSHYGSSDDDGSTVHRINQFVIKQEIGRGSFGAVHLAVDQYGQEYAVKEFSKSRLRKRAQSNLLRQGNQRRRPGHLAAGVGFNSPLHRVSSSDRKAGEDSVNSLNLIKEEIAIMKKLSHNNLVSLIEVLDDPAEDSLYMVLEMCKKGVVMKVGLEERAEPYPEEACRCWFRDMILGIEYLHAQGVVHRDIKPDNCLITEDDVLKIVDFGVSEMFEKESDMATAKSAGSPAFMPPELCVPKHGQVSGKAADIWSMGVTLYCLRYGHIPFEKTGILELYDSIRNDDLKLDEESDQTFEHLMRRILEKDPEKRITMEEMREHPWVTKNGTDPLLSAEENCSDLVEPPTEAEMNHAITGNMGNLMVVVRAVKRFKNLLSRRRPRLMQGIFGRDSRFVSPPQALHGSGNPSIYRSLDTYDRRPFEQALAMEGVHRDVPVDDDLQKLPHGMDRLVKITSQDPADDAGAEHEDSPPRDREKSADRDRPTSQPEEHRPSRSSYGYTFPVDFHAKGHAHDPLLDTLYLGLGASSTDADSDSPLDAEHPVVSESPPGIDENIYEQAYQDEIRRVIERRGKSTSMYLNRRVDHLDGIRSLSNFLDRSDPPNFPRASTAEKFSAIKEKARSSGLATLVREAKEKVDAEKQDPDGEHAKAGENAGTGDKPEPDTGDGAQQADPPVEEPLADGIEPTPRPRKDDNAAEQQAYDYRQSLAFDIPGTFQDSGGSTNTRANIDGDVDAHQDDPTVLTASPADKTGNSEEATPLPRQTDKGLEQQVSDHQQNLAFDISGTVHDASVSPDAEAEPVTLAQQDDQSTPTASSAGHSEVVSLSRRADKPVDPRVYDYRQSLAFDLPGTFPPTPNVEREKGL